MELVREILHYKTEAEWLQARKQDITSTECSALLGCSPYSTEYKLYQMKTGALVDDFQDNDRTRWGRRLEDSIALGIAEDYGLIVEPFKCYIRIPLQRVGSSFDYKVVGLAEGFNGDETARDMFRKHGVGILEIKNVDGLQFRRAWIDDGETVEAPPHIEAQVQHQMHVADLNWSMIAPLVGGNTPKVLIRERDEEVITVICQYAARFWEMVDAGTPPKPDFAKDADTIARLYVNNDGTAADLSDNTRLVELCVSYKAAAADEKVAAERKKAAKAEITTIIEAHKSITTDGFKISAGTNKEVYKAYRREAGERITITVSKIPPADIESTTPAYRNIRITEVAA